jgi:hypothetical protein
MMKKILYMCLCWSFLFLTSCGVIIESPSAENTESSQTNQIESSGGEKSMTLNPNIIGENLLAKLSQIKKTFTAEQVHEILGEPDEIPPTGIYYEIYYAENNAKIWIAYLDSLLISIEDANGNSEIIL